MPRIRTIKPEMLQHPKVGRLTDRQIRLWVGLITQADDEGRLVADAGQLRFLVFGYFPDVSEGDVNEALEAIARVRLIQLYNVDDVRYAWIVGWKAHPKIDRKTLSRLPPCALHRALDESSTSPRSGSDQGSDQGSNQGSRIGVEGNGTEAPEAIGEPRTRSYLKASDNGRPRTVPAKGTF